MTDSVAWRAFAEAAERGAPVTGVVWRCTAPTAKESSAQVAARLEAELGNLLGAAQTVKAAQKGSCAEIVDRHRAGRGTEPGEPVDPVQAALWGFGRTAIAEQPTLRCDSSIVTGRRRP